MKSANLGKATRSFQTGTASALAKYLLSAGNKDGGSASEFAGIDYDYPVNEFNKTNTAGLQLGWDNQNQDYTKQLLVKDKDENALNKVKYDPEMDKN